VVDRLPLLVVNDPKTNRVKHYGKSMKSSAFSILVAHKSLGEKYYWNAIGCQFHVQGRFSKILNVIGNYIPPNKLLNESETVVRLEEKSVDLLLELIDRYSQKGSIVADFFFGTGSAIEAAIKLDRFFIGCDKDPVAFAAANNRVDYVVEEKMNNSIRSEPVKKSRRRSIATIEDSSSNEDIYIDHNNRPPHLRSLLQNYPSLLKTDYLAMECIRMGVSIKESIVLPTIEAELKGFGCFTNRKFKEMEVIGEYYGDLLTEEDKDERYNSLTYLPDRLFLIEIEKNWYYIDGDTFCPVTYINDAKGSNLCYNCEFFETSNGVSVRTLVALEEGVELLLDYGGQYFTGFWIGKEYLRQKLTEKMKGKETEIRGEVVEAEKAAKSDEVPIVSEEDPKDPKYSNDKSEEKEAEKEKTQEDEKEVEEKV
jgi:hypothetical protein